MLDGSLENCPNCKCGQNARCPAMNIPTAWGILHYHPTANENMNCYDDSCDLSGSSTWFLLCRSQDTFICIQNFEHETMGGLTPGVGAGWLLRAMSDLDLDVASLQSQAWASWARTERWDLEYFFGRFCWQGMLLVFFSSSFFPLVRELRHEFWRCFFFSHEKFWPSFGDRNPLTGHVVSIRFYVKYTRFNITMVFNQQCQNPWVTAIRIDCQTAFYLHPNIEFYLFLADSTLRISRDQVCAQVSTYQDTCIRHSWLELPIAALIPLLTPILILPRCPSRNRSKELMMTWIQRLEA